MFTLYLYTLYTLSRIVSSVERRGKSPRYKLPLELVSRLSGCGKINAALWIVHEGGLCAFRCCDLSRPVAPTWVVTYK